MATEGTPFRDRYASEARAAAARAHAPPVEEPPTPVPRRVHAPSSPVPRPAAPIPTPTPPSKLLQRYLASEATKISESAGASGGVALEAEVRARTRALELEVARADGASASAHTTYHGRRRVRNDDDGLDGAARGVDAAAKAVRRARAASARVDKENGVPLEVLKLARDVAKHIEASSRVLQDATAVLARLEDGVEAARERPAVVASDDEGAWTDGSSGAVPLTPRDAATSAESDAWTDASDDEPPPPPPTPPPED